MDLTFSAVYDRGLDVGWDNLSPQEHAVLLYRGIGEKELENERNSAGLASRSISPMGVIRAIGL